MHMVGMLILWLTNHIQSDSDSDSDSNSDLDVDETDSLAG